jgi:hypothetical protein
MFELRLIDPYGYTVPGAIYRNVPAQGVAEEIDRLRRDSARTHADRNDGINGYRFHVADYYVQVTPETTAAARGTFPDLLVIPTAA